jgi:hypothetical protein
MARRVVVVGSNGALAELARGSSPARLAPGDDVVLVPTAAAFSGATEAAVRLAALLEPTGARVEALMVADRTSADEEYFARRVAEADWSVLVDGSPLHARTVWRGSALAGALAHCAGLVAVGATATVLGAHMIDPRGGAPTTGLGLVEGVVFTTPASDAQLARTRSLLGAEAALLLLDVEGAVGNFGEGWVRLSAAGVSATRGDEPCELASLSAR